MQCIGCLDMNVEEGIPREMLEFDFVGEDALEFELQLAEARDIKFTLPLTEQLSIGTHIVCTGTPVDDIPWFAINIGCGEAETGQGEMAVHFNVRMPQCYVVRNTKRNGKWGSEETTAFRWFPFKADRPFTIEVLVDEKETLWAVDGEHYCSYAHRNPSPFVATWVQVTGIRDATLNVEKTVRYPAFAPPRAAVPFRATIHSEPENEPSWSPNAIATLPDGILPGHQIVIRGRLRPLLHSFAIDLVDSSCEWPRGNVHAHVNLRAHDEPARDRQLVVLNARLGAWGPERRQRTAKLVPGTKTTIRIVRGAGVWAVFADDVEIGELDFRAAADAVKAVCIRGDLFPEEIFTCPATGSPINETVD